MIEFKKKKKKKKKKTFYDKYGLFRYNDRILPFQYLIINVFLNPISYEIRLSSFTFI